MYGGRNHLCLAANLARSEQFMENPSPLLPNVFWFKDTAGPTSLAGIYIHNHQGSTKNRDRYRSQEMDRVVTLIPENN